jgi:rRNA processing protein Gar1
MEVFETKKFKLMQVAYIYAMSIKKILSKHLSVSERMIFEKNIYEDEEKAKVIIERNAHHINSFMDELYFEGKTKNSKYNFTGEKNLLFIKITKLLLENKKVIDRDLIIKISQLLAKEEFKSPDPIDSELIDLFRELVASIAAIFGNVEEYYKMIKKEILKLLKSEKVTKQMLRKKIITPIEVINGAEEIIQMILKE